MRIIPVIISIAVLAGVGAHHSNAADVGSRAAPRLEAIAVAPTEIRLTVDLADLATDVSATGGPEGEPPRSWYVSIVRQDLHEGRYVTHGRAVLSARPGTTYRFCARALLSRSGTDTPESDECVVKTPAEPREPPTIPSGVAVAAISPFMLELRWRFAGVPAYGFEIRRRDEAGEFRRVAAVEPDARRFVDHGRRPARRMPTACGRSTRAVYRRGQRRHPA